jgi:hypothetical protein
MGRNSQVRIAVFLLLLLFMIFLPWWFVFVCTLLCAFRFSLFIESLAIGVFFDVWFGYDGAHYGLLVALSILVVAEVISYIFGVKRYGS